MSKRTRNYQDSLLADLQDPAEAIAYLNAHLEGDDADPALFLVAMGDVLKAHGMSSIAEQTGLSRVSLYKSFSDRGNPTVTTLLQALRAAGLRFHVNALGSGQTASKS
jgi:probable addiction module antidote protein